MASGPMRRSRVGGERKRLKTIAPTVARGVGGQDHADGSRAAAEHVSKRGGHALRGVVERGQKAEQHRRTQGRARQDEPGTGEDGGQPGGPALTADRNWRGA